MIKLNRRVEYALIALKYMSAKKPGQLSTAKEISDKYGCPFDATSRVLQQMASAGILKSEQGAHGGYQIVKDLDKLHFYFLNELILGNQGIAKCFHKETEQDCELASTCNIVSPVRYLNNKLTDFLKSISVAEAIGIAEKKTTTSVGERVESYVI